MQRRTELALLRARKLVALLREPAYRAALRKGVAAGAEHNDVSFRHDFRTVIDVGAHSGQFALFARRRFPEARIYCVEPLPSGRKLIADVLDGQVEVLPFAATTTAKTVNLNVSPASDASSLYPVPDAVGIERVKGAPLDDLVPVRERPLLLKIDAQGAELDVLRGAEQLLADTDEVLVELSYFRLYEGQPLAGEVCAHLLERGFHLAGAFNPVSNRRGVAFQADYLFSRRQPNAPW